MNKKLLAASCGILIFFGTNRQFAQADDHGHGHDRDDTFGARLVGAQEVPASSTAASGKFEMTIAADDSQFTYQLTFSGLEGNVTQSHIHFGQPSVAGGIMIWLCGTATNPGPAGTPACPTPGGMVNGTVNASNVIGPSGQGIAAGEFAEALAAIRKGLGYANVHSTKFATGEIRGQIRED